MASLYKKNRDIQPSVVGTGALWRVKRKENLEKADEDDEDEYLYEYSGDSANAPPEESPSQQSTEGANDDDDDDGHEILESLSKLVTTKSLRLTRVSRLIDARRQRKSSKITRREKEKVFIQVVFLKIGEIDTMKEVYSTDVFIQARWREQQFDGKFNENPETIKWNKYWNPQLYVDNCVGDPKETISHTLMHNTKRREAYIVERRRLKGVCLQNFELNQFPFDTQKLTLTVLSALPDNEVEFEEDRSELSSVNVQSFVDEQEWQLYSNVGVSKRVVNLVYEASDNTYTHPSISFLCHASRRYGFYVWNIMFVMFWISAMSLVPWSISVSRPENRIQVTFILLLTTITFKFAVSSFLPRISYLTYLDYYILVKMVFMGLVCVWHAIAPYVHLQWSGEWAGGNDQSWPDKGLLIALSALFVTINVVFFTVIYCCAIQTRRKYEKEDRKHKKRIKIQQRAKGNTNGQINDIFADTSVATGAV